MRNEQHRKMNRYKTFLSLALFIVIGIATIVISCSEKPTANNEKNRIAANKIIIPVGKNPGSVEIADFNNDGQPDIVIAYPENNNATLLLNDGHGKFTQASGSPFPTDSFPNDIAIGDFNNDHYPDMAFANNETKHFSVVIGNGKGQFEFAAHSPFHVRSRPHVHGVAAGDFNGDGNLDLLTESWGVDSVLVLNGNGKADFASPKFFKVGKRPYQRVRAADVNKDGLSDIITTNMEGNNCSVLLANKNGGFTEAEGSPFPCGDAPFGVAINDVNNDGNPDLLIGDSPSITAESTGKDGLFVLLGDGSGKFSAMQGSPFLTTSPSRLTSGDRDANGFNDIAVVNYTGRSITIYMMDKNGIASTQKIAAGGHPDGIAMGDLNNDKKTDIVVSNFDDDTIMILFSE
jgi:hypothetical protein